MSDTPQHAPEDIRLLISDVDGTLVTHDKVLTPRAKETIRRVQERGIVFTITSARPASGLLPLANELGITIPVPAFNGGLFLNPDGTVIEQTLLPEAVGPRLIEIIEAHGLSAWVFTTDNWFLRNLHGPHADREAWIDHFTPTVTDDLKAHLAGAAKVVGVSDDYPAVEACEKAVREALGAQVSATRSSSYYLDITHPDANKGRVVRRLSAMLNIPTEKIATIGDGRNDILMFAEAGFSIAMGNGSEEVKKAATVVTASNEEEGFAQGIERYLLR